MTTHDDDKISNIELLNPDKPTEFMIKQPRIVSLRQSGAQQEKQEANGTGSMFHAISTGKINQVRHLLSHGSSISSKLAQSFNPLVAALHIDDDNRRNRMFMMLLKEGASYKVKDVQYRRSVMHWACVMGRSQQVSTLLEETAGDFNPFEKDKDGLAALHHAVLAGSLATVQVLVDFHVRFGISVDVSDRLGLTPYIYARRLGHKDIAQLLRNKGSACEERADNLFRTPRAWSTIGREERKHALGSHIQDQIKIAKIMGNLNMTKHLGSLTLTTSSKIEADSKTMLSNSSQLKIKSSPCSEESYTDFVKGSDGYQSDHLLPIEQHSHSDVGLHSYETKPTSSAAVDTFCLTGSTDSNPDIRVMSHSNKFFSENNTRKLTKTCVQNPKTISNNNSKNNQILPVIDQQNHITKLNGFKKNGNKNGYNTVVTSNTSYATSDPASSNIAALSLIEQTFPKRRIASDFHNSVLDTSKAAEYKYMLGNLMDIVSEHNTKSYRKSVKIQKPVTPIETTVSKNQFKISTWAILFGDKNKDRRKKSRHLHGSFSKRQDFQQPGSKREKLSMKQQSKGDKYSAKTNAMKG